jgi:hypothetical protein
MKRMIGVVLALAGFASAQGAVPSGNGRLAPTAGRIIWERALPSAGTGTRPLAAVSLQGTANGLGFDLPVVARLTGNEGVLYKTALDVSNFTTNTTLVDFYLFGTDLATNQPVDLLGSFTNDSTGTKLRAVADLHLDDVLDAIIQADPSQAPPNLEADGFLGSMVVVFDGFISGEGSVQARFYSTASDGTIGEALRGHEISGLEPQRLVGVFRDTRGEAGVPQLYTNLFLTNAGFLGSSGIIAGDKIRVELDAYSSATGQPVGTPETLDLDPFQTVSLPFVREALGIPPTEDTILLYATVVNGSSAILGLGATVDETTKDPSAFPMTFVY